MGTTESARAAVAMLAAGLFLLARVGGAGAEEAVVVVEQQSQATALEGDEPQNLQTRAENAIEESSRPPRPTASELTQSREPQEARRSPLTDRKLRADRIEGHRPSPAPADPRSIIPVDLRRALYTRWGGLLEWMAQHEAARDAYAAAIAFGQDDIAVWRALARMRLRSGDLEGAEAALLVALEHSYASSSRRESAEVHRDLGELYLLLDQPAEAGAALEIAWNRQPDLARVESLLARARHEFAPDQVPAPPGGVVQLLPATPAEERRAQWEARLYDLHRRLPGPIRDGLSSVRVAVLSPAGSQATWAAVAFLLVLLVFARRFRGHGDLVVRIEYPLELQGSFSVRLATTQGKWKRATRSSRANAPKTRVSTRTEHYDVGRETQFQRLHPGLYFVTVEGMLRDPESGRPITDPYEEQAVPVQDKCTASLDFDVGPTESPVDVKVVWDKQPAREATVAARGLPQSLRYARDGTTRLRLRQGRHTIVAGAGDRVAECEIDIQSFKATQVCIDLGRSTDLIFKGCPPAVEPYLHGDLNTAARALERDGYSGLAQLLLARLHRDQGQLEQAADHFEKAGRPLEAAELWAKLDEHERAARLFESAGETRRAADMYRAAGTWLSAGSAYESVGDFDSAVDCYRQGGDTGKWIDAMERGGDTFGAAELAVNIDDRARAIRLLQQITGDHPRHASACELLAAAYQAEGHRDLAIQKLEERLEAAGPSHQSPELQLHLADLLEQEEDFERALEVLEKLRAQEPTYPNVATRIELLRKKRSSQQLGDSRPSGGSGLAPTAFLSQTRYEILQEIGRGGMGIVFKARDTRLQRIVALKQLPENLREHPKAVALFLREAQSAARLNHPNIVTVYDTDQENEQFFITMEFLEGHPINQILRKRGRISPKNVAHLGIQIAAGLDYAHKQGIIHRDIKSANLFFTRDRTVKIMDFGLAKMMEEVRRGTTVIGGTPYYMAPEQAVGENVDHRADIYAFGVTLYELLTGRVPFCEGDVIYHHRHTPPPDPRQAAPEIPEALARLVLHMMEKQAEARCRSAAEVGERLTQLFA